MTVVDYSYETFRQVNPYLSFMIFAILMLSMLALYFLPSLIAMMRQHPQKWLLAGLNVFAGWTGLFWIGLLVWALWPREKLLAGGGMNGGFGGPGYPGGDWGSYQDHDRRQSFGGPAPTPGPEDTLEQLARLKERGILTEDEFSRAKAKLLETL